MGDFVTLGHILRPHGIAGAVRIRPDGIPAPAMADMLPDQVTAAPPRRGEPQTLTVQSVRVHKDHVLAVFAEIQSIEDAERYRGWSLRIPAADRPELPGGAWYADQIIGLTVVDAATGEPAGKVRELISGAAQDLLIIEAADGRRLALPFVEPLVGDVDITAGTIHATILEGLDELGF